MNAKSERKFRQEYGRLMGKPEVTTQDVDRIKYLNQRIRVLYPGVTRQYARSPEAIQAEKIILEAEKLLIASDVA
jgi:hypothetical protein